MIVWHVGRMVESPCAYMIYAYGISIILPTCHTIIFMCLSLHQDPQCWCWFTCCSQLFLTGIYRGNYVRENDGWHPADFPFKHLKKKHPLNVVFVGIPARFVWLGRLAPAHLFFRSQDILLCFGFHGLLWRCYLEEWGRDINDITIPMTDPWCCYIW